MRRSFWYLVHQAVTSIAVVAAGWRLRIEYELKARHGFRM